MGTAADVLGGDASDLPIAALIDAQSSTAALDEKRLGRFAWNPTRIWGSPFSPQRHSLVTKCVPRNAGRADLDPPPVEDACVKVECEGNPRSVKLPQPSQLRAKAD